MRLKESLKQDVSKLVVEGAEKDIEKRNRQRSSDRAIKDLVTKI